MGGYFIFKLNFKLFGNDCDHDYGKEHEGANKFLSNLTQSVFAVRAITQKFELSQFKENYFKVPGFLTRSLSWSFSVVLILQQRRKQSSYMTADANVKWQRTEIISCYLQAFRKALLKSLFKLVADRGICAENIYFKV